jgi:hypothetical protein
LGLTHPAVPRSPPGRPLSTMWGRVHYDTRFDRWLADHDVRLVSLVRASGYSRQHIGRIRRGEMEPTRKCIKAIVIACRRVSHEPVKANDLFDLGE